MSAYVASAPAVRHRPAADHVPRRGLPRRPASTTRRAAEGRGRSAEGQDRADPGRRGQAGRQEATTQGPRHQGGEEAREEVGARRQAPAPQAGRVTERLPDPALVVLVGASGSGKSTWAEGRLPARGDRLLRRPARRGGQWAARPRRLHRRVRAARDRRRGAARARPDHGRRHPRAGRGPPDGVAGGGAGRSLPAVAVLFPTPDAECRRRNAERDRPVPAPVLAGQLKRMRSVADELAAEGWDVVHQAAPEGRAPEAVAGDRLGHTTAPSAERRTSQGLEIVLQVSRFPWGEDPAAWLREVALAADAAGFAGVALMDHLVQIPQVGPGLGADPRALGHPRHARRARHRARLGTLVHPGDLPPGRGHRQGRRHARRAQRRPGLRRDRRRAGGSASTPVTASPSRPTASGSTCSRRRSRPCARCGAAGTKAYAGDAGEPARDHVVPAARRADPGHRRRRRGEAHAPDRRPAGRRDQRAVRPEQLDRKIAVLHEHCRPSAGTRPRSRSRCSTCR